MNENNFNLAESFCDSELVIGLVGAVGTDLRRVSEELIYRLKSFNYDPVEIRVSHQIIPEIVMDVKNKKYKNEFERIDELMTAGDKARKFSKDNSILAMGVAAKINELRNSSGRKDQNLKRKAFIVNSIKHPEEVARLRQIYPEGFYLLGVYSDYESRCAYLKDERKIENQRQIDALIERDTNEHIEYGQKTSETFHLSDFFVYFKNQDKIKHDIWRILKIMFNEPFTTPSFDEFAMFMAFSASLRSADLSRQVGAVITRGNEILSTGANDTPKFGGGLYWPVFCEEENRYIDIPEGRDYTRGRDSNKEELDDIVNNIVEVMRIKPKEVDSLKIKLKEQSKLRDITEYGRVVHAEMEAILSCARNNVSTRNGTLYCTTYPCHNCAKHIIASGIKRVVYIEPYPKSKAVKFHGDALYLGFQQPNQKKVVLEPFVGIGPRRFFDLFSMHYSSGIKKNRKNSDGMIVDWKENNSNLRMQMLPISYLEMETYFTSMFNTYREVNDECSR